MAMLYAKATIILVMRPSPVMLYAKTPAIPPPSRLSVAPRIFSTSIESSALWLTLLRTNGVQNHLIGRLHTTPRIPLTPVITDCIRKHLPIPAKRRSRDAPACRWERPDPHVRVLVPEVERAVRARRAEGAVDRVE